MGSISVDPISHALMIDPQMAGNSSQVEAIDIQLHRLQPYFIAVTRQFRLWRVMAHTVLAFIALRSRFMIAPCFDLPCFLTAVCTFHLSILSSILL